MNYNNFPNDVRKGEHILLDDGKLIFEILKTDKNGNSTGMPQKLKKQTKRTMKTMWLQEYGINLMI